MWRSLVCLILLSSTAFATEPVFDAIDYATPSKYLVVPDSLGNQAEIAAQALKLKGKSDRKTVLNVLDWMTGTLKYKADEAYHWRNYDTVVKEGCYGGCADYAIVCGVLLKRAGIPTVWVKTMDVLWIWDLKQGRPFQTWSGHVFLEVYLDKQWVLLDPGARKLYPGYSPQSRILPGNRFAYHKGNDPKAMIMSLQWEDWKQQTREYFTKLDASLLPTDEVAAVKLEHKCYIIGNAPYYQMLQTMAQREGWTVKLSFNTDYDKHLPQARGSILLIETHQGVPIVPLSKLEQYFSGASQGLKAGHITLGDTKIVFVDFKKLLHPELSSSPDQSESKPATSSSESE
ncbi:Transglutaminase-like superfamily protein [Gimesia alba]|uniref:Transglutaminase-like superfamily protein n=1 Tax=Gimesia alba TaxID=2527973 RepID=A0A517RL56_9PLAN|nr:transglutaminase domain-containing protein [Gimesia alba]QDT44611.1 Transglutaminase-like superfamily protein [Gimesia alba]